MCSTMKTLIFVLSTAAGLRQGYLGPQTAWYSLWATCAKVFGWKLSDLISAVILHCVFGACFSFLQLFRNWPKRKTHIKCIKMMAKRWRFGTLQRLQQPLPQGNGRLLWLISLQTKTPRELCLGRSKTWDLFEAEKKNYKPKEGWKMDENYKKKKKIEKKKLAPKSCSPVSQKIPALPTPLDRPATIHPMRMKLTKGTRTPREFHRQVFNHNNWGQNQQDQGASGHIDVINLFRKYQRQKGKGRSIPQANGEAQPGSQSFAVWVLSLTQKTRCSLKILQFVQDLEPKKPKKEFRIAFCTKHLSNPDSAKLLSTKLGCFAVVSMYGNFA